MILKNNPTEKTHFIAYKSNFPAGTTLPPTYTTLQDKGTYKTGMGEVRQVQRPGSDLSHIRSKGL